MSFGFLRRLRGPLLGAALASLVFVTAGLAGSGVGGIFNLGVANTVDAQSSLSGTVGGAPQLQVDNASASASSSGIFGRVTSTAGGANSAGVRGANLTTSSNGFGIFGLHNGSGIGVMGQSATGIGVMGEHHTSNGVGAGVQGLTNSQTVNAAGVLGQTSSGAQGTAGVRGVAGGEADGVLGEQLSETSGVNSAGVVGSNLGEGIGVLGKVSNSNGAAISANQNSNGIGLDAESDGGIAGAFESFGANAVEATTHHTDGIGLLGVALAGSLGVGVEGSSTSGTGGKFFGLVTGVFGSVNGGGSVGVSGASVGTNGIGVEGSANTGASAIGVHGRSTSGLAGKFDGNVRVTGKLTKDYKSGSTPSQAIPIAYGSVNADGTLASGTPNVTTALSGTSYRIVIAGEPYTTTGYATVVTPNGNAAFGKTGANTGKLVVALFSVSGSQIATSGFSFITYKP